LKGDHAKIFAQLQKLIGGSMSSSEVPGALMSAARLRMDMCNGMRAHASSATNTEVAYKRIMDERTAASDKAARTFGEEYKKFLEKMDAAK
jgi:hypothetical protein